MFTKINNIDIKGDTLYQFQLDLALIYFHSDILERQIQGLRIISDIIKQDQKSILMVNLKIMVNFIVTLALETYHF